MKEIRTVLTETTFTNLCKKGFIKVSTNLGTSTLNFNKTDIVALTTGEIIEKTEDDTTFLFALQDLGVEIIREIVKRSPIFSDLSQEIK